MRLVPTNDEIKKIFDEMHTPPHVRKHCEIVAAVADFLCAKMLAQGHKIDAELTHAAAFLHDIVRYVDFKKFEPESFIPAVSKEDIDYMRSMREHYKGTHHADAAADILEEKGMIAIAPIVREHKFVQIMKGFSSLEAKVVYYSDKRVKHDAIVPLEERLLDGRKRNSPSMIGTPETEELDKKVFALEAELCALAGIEPKEVK